MKKLALGFALASCTLAGFAAAQLTLSPPKLTATPSAPAITAITNSATCGGNLSSTVTIHGGSKGGTGTLVFGAGTTKVTAPYKVAASASITLTLSTPLDVKCGTTGAAVPGGTIWLEPMTGGSDAMMWVVSPASVTYNSTKQPIPG